MNLNLTNPVTFCTWLMHTFRAIKWVCLITKLQSECNFYLRSIVKNMNLRCQKELTAIRFFVLFDKIN